MKSSTGCPALTISMTLRGFSSSSHSSATLFAPAMFLPFARPARKRSVFSAVRL